jgi:ribosomal protein S27AE
MMGAWMCPECGHGSFVYPYRNLTVMCAREGCGYIERRDEIKGTRTREEHRQKEQS